MTGAGRQIVADADRGLWVLPCDVSELRPPKSSKVSSIFTYAVDRAVYTAGDMW